jgi:hypothetical protein
MSQEAIDIILAVLGIVVASLGGGAVSARMTKTTLETNYKELFVDATEQLVILTSDSKDLDNQFRIQTALVTQQTIDIADLKEKLVQEGIGFNAKVDLIDSQREKQEERHAKELAEVVTQLAALAKSNAELQEALEAAVEKLSKTEEWVDILKDRLNPPELSTQQAVDIQALRDTPPIIE